MAYCVVTDIQSEFKNMVFSNTTFITPASVTQMIVEAGAYIDSCVGTRYVVPLADSMSLSLMSLFCRTLVAERVRAILAVKQATNTDGNQNERGAGFSTKDVMSALKNIMDGVMPLPGATLLLQGAGFKSRNYEAGEQPRFKKDSRQW